MTLSSPQREWQEEQKDMVPHFNTFIPVALHPPTSTPILSRRDSSWTCHRCWLQFMKVVILVAGVRLLYLVLAALLWWCTITDTFVSHMWGKPLEKLMYKLKSKACHIYPVFLLTWILLYTDDLSLYNLPNWVSFWHLLTHV